MLTDLAFFHDFERADKKVRDKVEVPTVLIRAAGLTNKAGKGKYKVILQPTVFFLKFIARADVAKFFVDCLQDTFFDKQAVMIEGA